MFLLFHLTASGNRLDCLKSSAGFRVGDTAWRDALECLRGRRGLKIAS